MRVLVLLLAASAMHAESLRVMTWNIAGGAPVESIAAVIGRERADLVLLQEVDLNCRRSGFRDVAADLAQRLGMQASFVPAFVELGQSDGRSEAVQGQAILARTVVEPASVLRFARQDWFWKPGVLPPSWSVLKRRGGGRVAQIATIEPGLRVINVHLESQTRDFGVVSNAQFDELMGRLRAIPPDQPLILAGDFNSFYNPNALSRRMREAGFTPAFDAPVRTHHVAGALDWIFVRGGLTVSAPRVIRGTGASDHDPVVADVQYGVQYSEKQKTILLPSGDKPYSPFSSESYTSKR